MAGRDRARIGWNGKEEVRDEGEGEAKSGVWRLVFGFFGGGSGGLIGLSMIGR